MKRIIFAAAVSAMSSSSFAAGMVSFGFGRDGATGQSMPTENSVDQAAAVHAAVAPAHSNENVKLETDAYEIEIQQDGFSAGIAISSENAVEFEKTSNASVAGMGLEVGNVTFTGTAAEALYKALKVKPTPHTVGATNKTVANLSCAKISTSTVLYRCRIQDVNYLEM
jgi:hypothetical protein